MEKLVFGVSANGNECIEIIKIPIKSILNWALCLYIDLASKLIKTNISKLMLSAGQ